jgi:hypothetical protein
MGQAESTVAKTEVQAWTVEELCAYLAPDFDAALVEVCKQHSITGSLVLEMDKPDFEELGIKGVQLEKVGCASCVRSTCCRAAPD